MENNEPFFENVLDKALMRYSKLKGAIEMADETKDKKELYEILFNAMYDLCAALGKTDIYAMVRIEFFDNIAKCAFRKGNPIDMTKLVEERKVSFEPAYLSIKGGERSLLILGVHPENIDNTLREYGLAEEIVKGSKPMQLPLSGLYDLGIRDTNEEEDLEFNLVGTEGSFTFGINECRLIASGEFLRERFVSAYMDRVYYKTVAEDFFPPIDWFKTPIQKA